MFKILNITMLLLAFALVQQNGQKVKKEPVVSPKRVHMGPQLKLQGVYEYKDPDKTGAVPTHCYLEFKGNKTIYYGSSEDFDMVGKGDGVGFFAVEIPYIDSYKNTINFSVEVSEADMFKNPITPFLSNKGNNEPWGRKLTQDSMNFQGTIKDNGNTIVLLSEGKDDRVFVKLEQ